MGAALNWVLLVNDGASRRLPTVDASLGGETFAGRLRSSLRRAQVLARKLLIVRSCVLEFVNSVEAAARQAPKRREFARELG